MQKVVFAVVLAAVLGIVAAEISNEELLDDLKIILQRSLKSRVTNHLTATNKLSPATTLACPIPITEHPIERTEKNCGRDSDCSSGEKCCDWYEKKHCLAGIDTRPIPGECPKTSRWNDACLADHVSCRYDAECPGEDDKCCMNMLCGYRDCLNIRQNLACPRSEAVDTNRTLTNCSRDPECATEEKCCDIDNMQVCVSGVNTIQKMGICPAPLPAAEHACPSAHQCGYDSECSGSNDRCCQHPSCGHRECMDMNRDFRCPWNEAAALSTPTIAKSDCQPDNSTCTGYSLLCCPSGVDPSNELVHQCIPGTLHTPKPGQCPPAHLLHNPNVACLRNYPGGCQVDDDCFGHHKCCRTACHYSECVNIPPPAPPAAPPSPDVDVIRRVINLLTGGQK